MTTPQHCPGFEAFRNLKSFQCKCPQCGASKEVFSDEFDALSAEEAGRRAGAALDRWS